MSQSRIGPPSNRVAEEERPSPVQWQGLSDGGSCVEEQVLLRNSHHVKITESHAPEITRLVKTLQNALVAATAAYGTAEIRC